MSSQTMSISIDFYGLPLIVVGDYYPETKDEFNPSTGIGQPGDCAEFYIESFTLVGCPTADPESIVSKAKLWEELERQCVEQIQDGE